MNFGKGWGGAVMAAMEGKQQLRRIAQRGDLSLAWQGLRRCNHGPSAAAFNSQSDSDRAELSTAR